MSQARGTCERRPGDHRAVQADLQGKVETRGRGRIREIRQDRGIARRLIALRDNEAGATVYTGGNLETISTLGDGPHPDPGTGTTFKVA